LRMGPIHTRAGRDELLAQIESGTSSGGELLIGGGTAGAEKGWFLEPAVIAEPAADSRVVTEEVFGPVLPVLRYSDFDDAIARANDTPYGLGSSIWTHDVRKIHRAAQEIDAGMTWVNQIHYGYDELPFGGMKDSGFGKEHGLEALDSYVELKSVVVVRSASERFFCAGADIKAFLANAVDANMEMIRTAHTTLGRIATARQAF